MLSFVFAVLQSMLPLLCALCAEGADNPGGVQEAHKVQPPVQACPTHHQELLPAPRARPGHS